MAIFPVLSIFMSNIFLSRATSEILEILRYFALSLD